MRYESRTNFSTHLSYWGRNPYLTSRFTGENDSLHPQWVIADLNVEKPVSAIRIAWVSPSATILQVEHWVGKRALDFDAGPQGEWKAFPSGVVKNSQAGLKEQPTTYCSSSIDPWHSPSSLPKSIILPHES